MSNLFGVDLGTSNIRIYRKGNGKNYGIVLNEPSIAALKAYTENLDVVAAGNDVNVLLGKIPGAVTPISPIKRGLPLEFEISANMLSMLLKTVIHGMAVTRPSVITGIRSDSTEDDRHTIEDVFLESGCKKVILADKSLVTALGLGYDLTQVQGGMIADIGGGITEITTFNFSGIDSSVTIPISGCEFNEAIKVYVKSEKNIILTDESAEKLKINPEINVSGRNLITGLPSFISLDQNELYYIVEPLINNIGNSILEVLNDTTPKIVDPVYENGITLTGGGALFNMIDRYLNKVTGIDINIAENPMTCFINGLGKIIEDIRKYDSLIISSAV